MPGDIVTQGAPHPGNPPFGYRLRTRVELTDTDLGGVVYYARYPHLLDRAVIAYRRHLGIPPLGPDGHVFVVRRLTAEYLSPARFDEEVDVWVRTAAMGRSSHTVALEVVDAATGTLRCRAEMVLVGLAGYDRGGPTRIPAPMAQAIRTFEGDGVAA